MSKRKETRHYSKDIPKFCIFCDEEFLGYRNNAKYCSDTCRYAWTARNHSEKQKKRRQEYQKKWGTLNWQRRRDYMIEYTYGITAEQYEELLEKQHYSCGVCGRHETEFSRKLAIDHDHGTGEIYGLLCRECNHTLIGKQRSPDLFLKAAKYLKKGIGLFVPAQRKLKRKKRVRRIRPKTQL